MVLGDSSHPGAPYVDRRMLHACNNVGRAKTVPDHCLSVCNQRQLNNALDHKTPDEAYFVLRPRPIAD
jgi:hypothetical protein